MLDFIELKKSLQLLSAGAKRSMHAEYKIQVL